MCMCRTGRNPGRDCAISAVRKADCSSSKGPEGGEVEPSEKEKKKKNKGKGKEKEKGESSKSSKKR